MGVLTEKENRAIKFLEDTDLSKYDIYELLTMFNEQEQAINFTGSSMELPSKDGLTSDKCRVCESEYCISEGCNS